VEDDFTSRKLLQMLISPYSDFDIAVDGKEAVEAFRKSLEDDQPYDLICLDIEMPKMDGHAALKVIRKIENDIGVLKHHRVKVIMTTSLSDRKNIMRAINEKCEAYLLKPIEKNKLFNTIKSLDIRIIFKTITVHGTHQKRTKMI